MGLRCLSSPKKNNSSLMRMGKHFGPIYSQWDTRQVSPGLRSVGHHHSKKNSLNWYDWTPLQASSRNTILLNMIKIDWKNWVINKPENLSSLCACDYASSHSCSTTFKLNYLNVFNYIAASAKWLGSFRRSEFSFLKISLPRNPTPQFSVTRLASF